MKLPFRTENLQLQLTKVSLAEHIQQNNKYNNSLWNCSGETVR